MFFFLLAEIMILLLVPAGCSTKCLLQWGSFNISQYLLLIFHVIYLISFHYYYYSGRKAPSLKMLTVFFLVVFVVVFLVLPILHFGRWLVSGTFAVCSSYVRPVNRNKWRRAIWNAHMTYKRIRLMPYFLPCGVHQFSLVCLYFTGNFRPKNFWFRHAYVVSL